MACNLGLQARLVLQMRNVSLFVIVVIPFISAVMIYEYVPLTSELSATLGLNVAPEVRFADVLVVFSTTVPLGSATLIRVVIGGIVPVPLCLIVGVIVTLCPSRRLDEERETPVTDNEGEDSSQR